MMNWDKNTLDKSLVTEGWSGNAPTAAWANAGGTGAENDPWVVTTWAELKEKMEAGGYIRLNADVSDPTKSSSSYLSVPSGVTVTLNLNGHTIDRALTAAAENGFVINVIGNLTVTDGSVDKTGKITGGKNRGDLGGGGVVVLGGTFNMSGGSITGNSAWQGGGGVYVIRGGTFNMSGGSITGNNSTNTVGYGGGVYVNDGCTFAMTGGSITGNSALLGGGGVCVGNSTFTMTGGSISDNSAGPYGGGVFVDGGTVTMSGTPVINNNKNNNSRVSNVIFYGDELITVTGALTTGANICVTAVAGDTAAVGGKLNEGSINYTLTADDAAKFHSDAATLAAVLDGGKVVFKDTPGINGEPSLQSDSCYDGESQALTTGNINAEGGNLLYAVTTSDSSTPPTEGWRAYCNDGNQPGGIWPAATDAGTYYVWYYAQSNNEEYADGPKIKCGSVTIGQKEVGLNWSNTSLTFNGSAQAPTATATGTANGDTISVTVSGAQTDARTGYTATASGLTGEKAANYKLPAANTTTFTIGRAAHSDQTATGSAKLGASGTVDLSALIVDGGTASITSTTDADSVLNGNPSVASGKLNFAFKDVEANKGKTAAVTVKVTSQNYADYNITATLTVLDKLAITPTVTLAGWTYGDAAKTPSVSGNTGNGAVAYAYKVKGADDNTYAAGVPTKAGEYTVRATITETTDYGAGEALANFTISKATITITAKSPSIQVGGTVPTPGEDSYTVAGLKERRDTGEKA